MTVQEMMKKIGEILENSKTGILATLDENGQPNLRWMTPSLIREWPDALFAVTSPHSTKVKQLNNNNHVSWSIQSKTLYQIVHIKGTINIVDNPSLKAQVMEAIGMKLTVFWNINTSTDFIVLETDIQEARWYSPMKGISETVVFHE